MQARFVHLRVHTEYSIVDGLVQMDSMMEALPKLQMNAVAVTDLCNLFATVKFYQKALSSGIKPIIGCELPCFNPKNHDQPSSLILLCMHEDGYRNLTQLISRAYQEGQHKGLPRADYDWLLGHTDGLLALSGGLGGRIGQALKADDEAGARGFAERMMSLFPNRFYLEIQRTGRADEVIYNERVVRLAESLDLPLVATNDVRFLLKDDHPAHEARVCIHDGYTLADSRRKRIYSKEQYLRSADEMVTLFQDLQSACENTVEIAKRCSVTLDLGHNYLPNFVVPDGTSVEGYLSKLARDGLLQRLPKIMKGFTDEETLVRQEPYNKRLQLELDVINAMGFAGYFLIVADFIQWAKQNDVPVGPGRGSGVGSLVAYALQITGLDPLEYDLLFERFLNPERVSMPDFDIDFCMEGRDRVIEYVAEKYGRQSVSQIITFGTMAAKAVVRDVGRVLGHPYGFVDALAKLIPFELGVTLKKALQQEDELKRRYHHEEEVKALFDLAQKLEGTIRNAGKHAGGVVIAPSQLTDFTAIYCEEGSTQIVSQFDKDDVEAVGLVKFDFLGLRTLTIIDWTLKTINQKRDNEHLAPLDINDIPMDDRPTFDLLKVCHTTAVFQLESRGMKELIHRLQPECFEEIVALVALFRPGPLQSGMVDDFIDRKHGRAKVGYPHSDLEPVLKATYGVILYQEQVMQIAQILANYTLGSADLLRRAMGKKKPEEMAKQRLIFIEGAKARGVDARVASNTFDLMEKFAGYGFNKSHAAAYALVAYQTAWLKAHCPAAFMAAVLSSDIDNTDKVVTFIHECERMALKVLPPSINQSCYRFTMHDDATILYGLGAIKGVGESAIQCIVLSRQSGPFTGLFDFCSRLDLRKVNRRVLESLIKSGTFDEWGVERAVLFHSIDRAIQMGTKLNQNQRSGQMDLFELIEEAPLGEAYIDCEPFTTKERLCYEKATLGRYVSGHPAALYHQELKGFVQPIKALNPRNAKKAVLCGLIQGIRRIMTKRGKKLAIISLEDPTGGLDVVAFAEIYEPGGFVVGDIVVIEGELGTDDYNGGLKMTATALFRMDEARTRFAKCLSLTLSSTDGELLPTLQSILKAHLGRCVVQIRYSNDEAQASIYLAPKWRVTPSDELLYHLTELLDERRVELCY